jgi:hypothetical protein
MNEKKYDEISILENCMSVARRIDQLNELSWAVRRIGLTQLSEELEGLATSLTELNDSTRIRTQQMLHSRSIQASESSDNMFRAVFNVLSKDTKHE